MQKFTKGLMAVIFAVSLLVFMGYGFMEPATSDAANKKIGTKKAAKKGPSPVVTVMPQLSEVEKNMTVDIIGTGFEPGKEVRVLFTDEDGMQSDIGYALDPAPQANAEGAFVSTWEIGRYIRAGVVKPGAFVMTITDDSFKPLAKTFVFFKKGKKKEKKK